MDFVTNLPNSDIYDTILVVIDRETKMSHFIPCAKDLDVLQLANLFMKESVRLDGLPHNIFTARRKVFTSALLKESTRKLEVEQRLSTAFHPQRDRQTERSNSILELYLLE